MTKPENKVSESYLFLRCYDMDLEMALHTIKMLKRYRKKDVRYALLRDIVISYGRPFSMNKGMSGKKDEHRVDFQKNKDCEFLHGELLTLRNQLFAHTDLDYKNPKIANWSKGEGKWYPMSFKQLDYDYLDNNVLKIKKLIEYVQIELREQLKRFEKSL